jgi:hypothetical protein
LKSARQIHLCREGLRDFGCLPCGCEACQAELDRIPEDKTVDTIRAAMTAK